MGRFAGHAYARWGAWVARGCSRRPGGEKWSESSLVVRWSRVVHETRAAVNQRPDAGFHIAHCFQPIGWKWASDWGSSYGRQSALDQEGEG